MGIYLNPNNWGFKESVNSEIYVDKSNMLRYTNKVLGTKQKNICVSRPRRFGKSMAAEMLSAYYSRGGKSEEIFDKLKISTDSSYREHLNQHNVIFINVQNFLSDTHNAAAMVEKITTKVARELKKAYPEVEYMEGSSLPEMFDQIFAETEERFVFIIDEWDCIFREKKENADGQVLYLDFLRNLLKDKYYVALAYMTGILPIKKYGSHSALNMFDEYSMTDPGKMAEFVGFTENEVEELCIRYQMDFAEVKRWYDGYQVADEAHVYNPRSVVAAMLSGRFSNYWSKTENYEALKVYIEMDFDGLKKTIVELLAGGCERVNPNTFQNDMTSFQSRDDVLTLLIHLGYLGYDEYRQEVFVPNYEVSMEFVSALQGHGWGNVAQAVKESERLIKAIWDKDAGVVEEAMENAHLESSILTYNNENSLACAISLALYSARLYYTDIREMPSGLGFADIVYLPRKNHLDKPAMIVELKWNDSVQGAIEQIKEKKYVKALDEYRGNLLLVAINYDKKTKKHQCKIEEFVIGV